MNRARLFYPLVLASSLVIAGCDEQGASNVRGGRADGRNPPEARPLFACRGRTGIPRRGEAGRHAAKAAVTSLVPDEENESGEGADGDEDEKRSHHV